MNKPPLEVLAVRAADVTKILSVSPATVDRLRRAGKLPSIKIGGTRLFRVEDVRRFLDSRVEDLKGGHS